jgi:hypothetical protein
MEVEDAGTLQPDPIARLSLNERLRAAIRWCRDFHTAEDDPDDQLATEFIRQLGYVGLKLVWAHDGSAIAEAQLADGGAADLQHQSDDHGARSVCVAPQ